MGENEFFEPVYPSEAAHSIMGALPLNLKAEMSSGERLFLAEMLLKTRPRKCLEVGVSAGGSSVIMLSALHSLYGDDMPALHSIDLCERYYRDNSLETGFQVNNFPHLKPFHKLFTGGLACEFMEEIGGGIDFVLLDTVHFLPGELLDYLMVLPYLSDNATIVLHDTNIHTIEGKTSKREWEFSNNLLLSAIHGKKFIMGDFCLQHPIKSFPQMPNIGAVKINSDTKKMIFNVINLLSIGWRYSPTPQQLELILKYVENKYDIYFANYLKMTFEFQKFYFPYFINKISDNKLKNKNTFQLPYRIINKYLFIKKIQYSLFSKITSGTLKEKCISKRNFYTMKYKNFRNNA